MHDLVEADLWEQLSADLYLQDEMQVAFHLAPDKDQDAPLSLAQAA